MRKLLSRVRDDRQQPVALFDGSSLRRADRQEDAELVEAVTRTWEVSQENWNRPLRRGDLLLYGPWLLVFGLIGLVHYLVPGLPRWVPLVVISVAGISMSRPIMKLHAARFSERFTASLLAYGRCASCGYPLDASVAEPDGCVQCPECGAAWRKARIGLLRHAVQTPASGSGPQPGWGWRSMVRMSQRAPSILDARNRAVPLVAIDGLRTEVERERGSSESQQIVRQVRRVLMRHRVKSVGLLTGFALLVVAGAYPAWQMGALRPAFGATFVIVSISMVIAAPTILMACMRSMYGRGQTTAPRIKDLLLGERLCPSCGRGLADALPSDDLVSECRCGAAWKLDGTRGAPAR